MIRLFRDHFQKEICFVWAIKAKQEINVLHLWAELSKSKGKEFFLKNQTNPNQHFEYVRKVKTVLDTEFENQVV